MKGLQKEDYLKMFRQLFLTRHTEQTMVDYHRHTPITELPHSSIGQEAISVGTCFGLTKEDQIVPSLRTRGAFLAKGVSSNSMMAGAFGKDIPETRGKNTSHHMGSTEVGVISGTGVVGAHLPVAVGVALAAKLMKKDYITVAYFGDGATNRGDFHESLNLASIWDLPVVFVCENNLYALSTPVECNMKIKDIATRASSYGIPGVIVDGNNVLEVYKAAEEAYDRARKGQGPTLIECKTYRWRGHSERDPRDARPKEEIEAWKEKCPVKQFRAYLLSEGIASEEEIQEIEVSVKAEVANAIKFAEECPYPPSDILATNVYSTEEAM